MRRFPSLLRFVALFLVLTVFNAGMAMASYVCPDLTTKVVQAQLMDGMPCAGMDIEKPVHCAVLSADSQASLDHQSGPAALTPISLALLVRFLLPLPQAVAVVPFSGEVREPDTSPPYLRTLRIRI